MGIVRAQRPLLWLLGAVFLLWVLRRQRRCSRFFASLKTSILKKLTCKRLGRKQPRVAVRKVDLFVEKVLAQGGLQDVDKIVGIFPRHFELVGHVVVVKLNRGIARDVFAPYARALAESFFPRVVDVVLLDTMGIVGELREPHLEVLWSSATSHFSVNDSLLKVTKERVRKASTFTSEDAELLGSCAEAVTFTTHVENGVRYSFDACKVMFCSGNVTERMHFASIIAKDEVVVDMFAGIGYFTLPLAINGGVKIVHALEKNKYSALYLAFNAVQNKVSDLIVIHCGDNRDVGSELCGRCDRVIMGYIPSCESFLPRAISFLRRSTRGEPMGVVHYHLLSEKDQVINTVTHHVRSTLDEATTSLMRIVNFRMVKSYAPKRFHFVVDMHFSSLQEPE
ncbi:methionine biosynthetic protein [Trypanosoma brucei equiperdum]|uniref:Methionine biosynthetic protein n=1 Tax=Trypanosoma brucei equiperdum TaxID=630700 RepID=A0A3L6KZE6_9TRYP|nr:methionine biosynthetic protein [Trypanosoma brucei equiperdum]